MFYFQCLRVFDSGKGDNHVVTEDEKENQRAKDVKSGH